MSMGTAFAAAFNLPEVARTNPDYANDVVDVTTGRTSSADIGAMVAVNQLQGLLYLAGGLIFGIALFRARVLTRWATALLAVGGVVSIVLAPMPDAFYRLLAYSEASAMIARVVFQRLGTRA